MGDINKAVKNQELPTDNLETINAGNFNWELFRERGGQNCEINTENGNTYGTGMRGMLPELQTERQIVP